MADPPTTEKEALERALLSIMDVVITLHSEVTALRRALIALAADESLDVAHDAAEVEKSDSERKSLVTAVTNLGTWMHFDRG